MLRGPFSDFTFSTVFLFPLGAVNMLLNLNRIWQENILEWATETRIAAPPCLLVLILN